MKSALKISKNMNLQLAFFRVKVNKYLETSSLDVLTGGDHKEGA
jgi:hypothetical protein